MKLFNKKKQKNESCDCDGNCTPNPQPKENNNCYAKVLGSGCDKCNELSKNTKQALEELGMDSSIQKITDFSMIAMYGVMSTPALVLKEKVVLTGKVASIEEIKELIREES